MTKTILYLLAFICLGLVSGSLGPTIPALAIQTKSQTHEISTMFLARSGGTMVGALLIGRYYDRIAGHPLLAFSLLASAIGMALTPAITVLPALIALSVFIGLAAGSINVGGNALIVLVHGERVRPFMSTLHFAFGLGGFLAPILFTQFLRFDNPVQITYWTLAALTIPTFALILFSRSPETHPHKHHEIAARLSLPLLALFLLFFFLEVGAEASVMGWYFSFASASGITEHDAGWMNSAFWAAFTAGRLATIWLSIRFKAISVIIAHLIFAMGIAIAMFLLPGSKPLFWLGAIGFGLAVAPIFPSTFGYAQRMLGLSGKLTGFFLVGSSAGGMFWPWLIGQFFKGYGPKVMLAAVLFDVIGALGVILFLHRSHAHTPVVAPASTVIVEEPIDTY